MIRSGRQRALDMNGCLLAQIFTVDFGDGDTASIGRVSFLRDDEYVAATNSDRRHIGHCVLAANRAFNETVAPAPIRSVRQIKN